jgi:hypothetical protein
MPTPANPPEDDPSAKEMAASRRSVEDADKDGRQVKTPWTWSKMRKARTKKRERRKRNIDPGA